MTTGSVVVDIALGPNLTAEEAQAIFDQGKEAVIFALLELAAQLRRSRGQCASVSSPATPSGMRPIHQKPNTRKRGKKPGRKAGHLGARRPPPEEVHQHKTHRAPCCPHCQGPLKRCAQTRTRYTEDIPESLQAEVTEHVIHRDWCPHCKKSVEPRVPDALPGGQIGNRVVALSAWLHYGQGQTLQHIVDVFNCHLHFQLTRGALLQQWYRLEEIFYPWYEQIHREALESAILNADETGWRVNGKGHWLWCFTAPELTFYLIDRRRGRPVVARFFRKAFGGTLVTDFWGPYNAVVCGARQVCLAHLLRDLEHVERYKSPSPQWPLFAKKLRRLVGDAIRLSRWEDRTLPGYIRRRDRLHQRLDELMAAPWKDKQARRLLKRFRRHREDLFTFLDDPAVPFDNNAAERAIRPAVIIRKNSYGNRSERGADTQAVLMSIYRTLKQRGHDPLKTITDALAEYLKTGKLPRLPP
jgi:transposase